MDGLAVRLRVIEMKNFRNYAAATLSVAPGRNFLYGPNGAGKTNLLEAIYFSATGASFRASRDTEVIGPTAESALVRAQFFVGEIEVETAVEVFPQRKRIARNGREVARSELPDGVLLFTPDDIAVTAGGPQDRRRFFDRVFATLVPGYSKALSIYHRVLMQRNGLLRRARGAVTPPPDLYVWDETLADAAATLCHLRLAGLRTVAPVAAARFRFLTGKALSLRYASAAPLGAGEGETRERVLAALHALKDEELRSGQTLTGPGRDDFVFLVEGRHLGRYGSRGEQRAAVLALKLAEAEIKERERREGLIYLLDDVFSELDVARQEALLAATADRQVFFTSTQKACIPDATCFRVADGAFYLEEEA